MGSEEFLADVRIGCRIWKSHTALSSMTYGQCRSALSAQVLRWVGVEEERGGSLNDGVNAGQCTHYTAVLLSVSTECGLSVLIV